MSQPADAASADSGPSMPAPPEAERTAPVVAPIQVQRAVQALYGLEALQVLAVLLGFFRTADLRESIRDSDPTLTAAQVSEYATLSTIFSTVFTLAIAGLWLLCGWKMLAGKTWARLIATILASLLIVIEIINISGGVIGSGSVISVVLTVVALALSIGFVVLAWSKQANAFFAAGAVLR